MTKSHFSFKTTPNVTDRPKADLVIVPFFQGKECAELAAPISDLNACIDPILQAGDFLGKEGSTLLTYLNEKNEKRLLLLGLGEKQSCNLETLRRAYSGAMRRCQNKKWPHVNAVLPNVESLKHDDMTRAIVEGLGLTTYVYEDLKSEENRQPFYTETVTLIGAKESPIIRQVEGILSGVDLARDLINGNALDITPQALAKKAEELAKHHSSLKVTILNKKDLEKEKLNLLLAVGNGSAVDPTLIMIEYRGNPKSNQQTMVVGKGVTFDTGGLNLKPTKSIEDMRADMSGAAATLGIIQAAAETKLEANIIGVIPSTENAIDGASYKPGDVYRSYLGKTVEITNTDAEGRLILADALAYGQKKFSPTHIIDMATLTGAIVIALGETRSGLFSNNDQFAKLCEEAGEETGELVWRLPLDDDYKKLLKSNIADLKNAATKRSAGSITAAKFLQEFILEKTPWIHLDIAGTAFLDSPEYYNLTSATGTGVRLVMSLLAKLQK